MRPPFCPNPRCSHHFDTPRTYQGHWLHTGFYMTKVVGQVMRFKCSACGKDFSERTFSIDYYTKRTLDYREIQRAVSQSESLSSISRNLRCSVESAQNRVDRLSRNIEAAHESLLATMSLSEMLVADGFESFDRSQFFPNQINILVGQQSQFLYGFTHATIRRKGAMTAHQKKVRARLELLYLPPEKAVEKSFARLLDVIPGLWDMEKLPRLSLLTDEHRAYPRSLAQVPQLRKAMELGQLRHEVFPSTAPRSITNPLFPVNYYDRELRKDIAAFRRESTCYTRNVANGLARFTCHLLYHNYQKPFRVAPGRKTTEVHAEIAGIDPGRMAAAMAGLYTARTFLSKQVLSDEGRKVWLKSAVTPLKNGPSYLPKYARK